MYMQKYVYDVIIKTANGAYKATLRGVDGDDARASAIRILRGSGHRNDVILRSFARMNVHEKPPFVRWSKPTREELEACRA